MPNNSPNKIGEIAEPQKYYTATFECSGCHTRFSATEKSRNCPTCNKEISSGAIQFADFVADLGFKRLREGDF
jgi:PHP family Zn ribbon phosphoesterase